MESSSRLNLPKLIREWGLEVVLKELINWVKSQDQDPKMVRLGSDLQMALDNFKKK